VYKKCPAVGKIDFRKTLECHFSLKDEKLIFGRYTKMSFLEKTRNSIFQGGGGFSFFTNIAKNVFPEGGVKMSFS
jgi:hypothetical protein